ncbi:hypothetical protein EC957_000340, partial [Mortierella hygrophila]
SMELFIAQQAIHRYGFVAVPFHDLRCSELLIEISNQTKMKVIIVDLEVLLLLSIKDCPKVEYNGTSGAFVIIKSGPSDIAIINYNTKSTLVAAMTGFTGSLSGAKKFTPIGHLFSYFTNGDVIGTWMTSVMVMAGKLTVFPFGLMKE